MKKNDSVKDELIETLVSRIARSTYMDNCFKISTREESVRDIVTTILDQYNVTEAPVKRPPITPGVVDITKKSNRKCEHCQWWDREHASCRNPESPKYKERLVRYYNCCKCFEWKDTLILKVILKEDSENE